MFNKFKEFIWGKKYTWNPKDMLEGKFPMVHGYSDLNSSKNTGRKRVMRMLLEGQYLSSLQMAKEFNETRLAAHVFELRRTHGYKIQDMWVIPESGKKYKEYYFKVTEVV